MAHLEKFSKTHDPHSQPTSRKTSLHQTLKKINKTLYRSSLHHSPLSLLQKSTLNSEKLQQTLLKTPRKKQKQDIFQQSLKSQHRKVQKMTQILELPKQPFGSHQTYNSQQKFIQKHFVPWDSQFPPQRRKELQMLSRKFRLFDKRQATQKKYKSRCGSNREGRIKQLQVFSMAAGDLVCQKQMNVLKAYDDQKVDYGLLFNRKSGNAKLMKQYMEMRRGRMGSQHVRKGKREVNKLNGRKYPYSAAVSPAGKRGIFSKLRD